jgi:Lon protease-like protein
MFSAFRRAHARRPLTLPLFPLRTVLFPGGVLPIKVFEQRYIDMTKACLRDDRPFGVCLLTQGEEVATRDGRKTEFAQIGTLARIVNWDMPQLGILHVATEGGARFRVDRHAVDAAGLVTGEVQPLPDEPQHPLPESYAALAKLLELIATRVGPQNFPSKPDYGNASWVGYRLAELLPLPLSVKQSMLEINDADVRLQVLQKFLAQQGLI